jgi:hypothetical protein
MTVTAPQLPNPGRVPIALTCRPTNVIDAYVEYLSPPGVSSIVTEGDCAALKECSFLVAVANPPSSIKIIDDVTVSITGAEFVPRVGATDAGIRASIVVLSTRELVLRIQTPPAVRDATLTCESDFCVCACATDVM